MTSATAVAEDQEAEVRGGLAAQILLVIAAGAALFYAAGGPSRRLPDRLAIDLAGIASRALSDPLIVHGALAACAAGGALAALLLARRALARRQAHRALPELSLEELQALDGAALCRLIEAVLRRVGFRADDRALRAAADDAGVDLVLQRRGRRIIVQCRSADAAAVDPDALQSLLDRMRPLRARRAVIVCTGRYTREALAFARGKPLRLVHGTEVLRLMKSPQDFRLPGAGVRPGPRSAATPGRPPAPRPTRAPAIRTAPAIHATEAAARPVSAPPVAPVATVVAAAAATPASNNLDHLTRELARAIGAWAATPDSLALDEFKRIVRRLERLRRLARRGVDDVAQIEIRRRRLIDAIPADRAPEDVRGLLLCLDLEVGRLRRPQRDAQPAAAGAPPSQATPLSAIAPAAALLWMIVSAAIDCGVV